VHICADTYTTFVGRVCFGEHIHWRVEPVRAIAGAKRGRPIYRGSESMVSGPVCAAGNRITSSARIRTMLKEISMFSMKLDSYPSGT
jgi:hypothetical protein